MEWVYNAYWGTLCVHVGPYTGGSYLTPPSGPLESGTGEYYLVVADPATVEDLSYEGFGGSIFAGIGQDDSKPEGYYTFDDTTPVPAGWDLYIIWYDAGYNDPPSNPPDPTTLYSADQAAGGTRAVGEPPPPPPIPPATNTTPEKAAVAADLYPNPDPPTRIHSYTLETAGVTWWVVRCYPRTTDPVSDASGGFTATVPSDVQLTVWRRNGLPLGDVPATEPIASGSGAVSVPTSPGQEMYLLRITGSGERRDGLIIVGLGMKVGQYWGTAVDTDWHIVPGEHTGWGHMWPGTEFYDGYVGFVGSYIETGLVAHQVHRQFVHDIGLDGTTTTTDGTSEQARQLEDGGASVFVQSSFAEGGWGHLGTEDQGSIHYDDATVQHYWNIELGARAADFIRRATNTSWTAPLDWAEIIDMPADSEVTFDDLSTYRWEAEYDLDYFELNEKVRLTTYMKGTGSTYGDNPVYHYWTRGKIANDDGPGYFGPDSGYHDLGYVNVSPNAVAYEESHGPNQIPRGELTLPTEYPLRTDLDRETWRVAPNKHADERVNEYDPSLIIGQGMGWDAKFVIQVYLILRIPRYRFRLYYIAGKKEIPMRQRHRDDGLATDAREFKGHASSQQVSNRRGGRTYY